MGGLLTDTDYDGLDPEQYRDELRRMGATAEDADAAVAQLRGLQASPDADVRGGGR
jgi:hypothetical protein